MRNIHHEEQDDQGTSSLFYIFILFITYNSGPASIIRETDDKKKHLHSVKYDQKQKFKQNYIGQAIMLVSYSIQ